MSALSKMPVVFTGHGYPMNAITDNPARKGWYECGLRIGRPKVIAALTSHWETSGTCVRVAADNPQLFDIVDLPDEIYNVRYAPPASPEYAYRILDLIGENAFEDNTWGIDHSLWTTLSNMYPKADIPVVIISTDVDAEPAQMYGLGKKLSCLRDEGVLLFATGNIAHNVDLVDHSMPGGFDWAVRFDAVVRDMVLARDIDGLIDYKSIPDHEINMPTTDHYWPLLFALGASDSDDKITVFNEYTELGSLSMTSYQFG